MIVKFIDITQIGWEFQTLPIEDVWFFSKFYINTFRVFSIGLNARVIARLKHSSSSFLVEMQRIAFRLMLSSCVCVCVTVRVCVCHVCGPQENGLR